MEPPSFQLVSLQLGVHDQSPFPQPQGTRQVPVTRPQGTTSCSNSPGYPRRGVLPHAGDYPTLTRRRRAPLNSFTMQISGGSNALCNGDGDHGNQRHNAKQKLSLFSEQFVAGMVMNHPYFVTSSRALEARPRGLVTESIAIKVHVRCTCTLRVALPQDPWSNPAPLDPPAPSGGALLSEEVTLGA